LKSLGWPSEKDRRGAADARFVDLLASASRTVTVSTFTLDEDTLVMRSTQLDEIALAGLSTLAIDADFGERPSLETLAADDPPPRPLDEAAQAWLALRRRRPGAEMPAFHGSLGPQPPANWTVSALETYLGCPFKFFALHVLKLREEPDDEEVMDPRRQGALVHEVFEAFFKAWQQAARGAITPENIDEARGMFERVVDQALKGLPPSEAGLERTRLLGSSAAAGLGDAVFRMEAERPVAVVERFLEHRLAGTFSIATSTGRRDVFLRGKADRLDLLEDGTFRLIDYKLGWPPNRARALQLPIYGVCAEQQLANHRGRSWTLGEAAYLAFKGPKRVVPLFGSPGDRDKALGDAQQRLADTLDAIERGEFPATPDDVYRCETCSVASVCRKDYVGDVRT
jgi:RecB family exonuclease